METPMGLGASAAMENPAITQTSGNAWYRGVGSQIFTSIQRVFGVESFGFGISSSLINIWIVSFHHGMGFRAKVSSSLNNMPLGLSCFVF